jgi:mRNA interferase MazF
MCVMTRGEVWWINFNPAVGGEIRKQRPAVIVSNDVANKHLNRIQVVPITSNTRKLYPSEAYVTLLGSQHKALADQITTVSKMRVGEKAGSLSLSDMGKIDHAIQVQLDLV